MSNRTRYSMAGAGAALVLGLTLWPSFGDTGLEIGFWCVLCGTKGTADAILNVLLFIPLGMGLGVIQGPLLALGGSLALSGLVELVQESLPGRFPTLGDLLFNATGGLLGAFLLTLGRRVLFTAEAPSRTLRWAGLFGPLLVFLATVLLLAPSVPDTVYHGQWTRDLGWIQAYSGRVLSAQVGQSPIPDGPLPDRELARTALRRGEPIRLEFVVGPTPDEQSHLMAVVGTPNKDILLLLVEGSDLLVQRRSLAAAIRLDQRTLRWRNAIRVPRGELLTLEVRQEGRDLCLVVDTDLRCGSAPGVEMGWSLIHQMPGVDPWIVSVLSALWLILLTIPAGLVVGASTAGSARKVSLVGLGLGASAAFLSWAAPWLSPHFVQVLGPFCGAWAGQGMRGLLPHLVQLRWVQGLHDGGSRA